MTSRLIDFAPGTVHTGRSHSVMPNTPIELLYDGKEVEEGKVPVEDMVDALVGFSSAYGKIARRQFSPDYGHRIRV